MSVVSAVLGFKDWGLDRLSMCMESVHRSLANVEHEIVVCDFGSADSDAVRVTVEVAGGVVTRVESGELWSRSRALNAAVRASRGDIILATDADMLFTPTALGRVAEEIERNPNQIIVLQCRDLPVGMDDVVVRNEGIDFTRFFRIGQVRPRWGMGGLVGIARDRWDRLRGWDERMHTYGGEDIDFVRRGQRMGYRTNWLDEPGVGMFHVWHPSSGAKVNRSAEAKQAVAYNQSLHKDPTLIRNLVGENLLPTGIRPVVSVVVAAEHSDEASAKLLVSVLAQTVTDLEILVTPALESYVMLDPRIRIGTVADARGSFLMLGAAGDWWDAERIERLFSLVTADVGVVADWSTQSVVSDGDVVETRVLMRKADAGTYLVRADLARAAMREGASTVDVALPTALLSGVGSACVAKVGRHGQVALHDDEHGIANSEIREKRFEHLFAAAGVSWPEPGDRPAPIALPMLAQQFDEDWFSLTVTCFPESFGELEALCGRLGWDVECVVLAAAEGDPLQQVCWLRGAGYAAFLEIQSWLAARRLAFRLGVHSHAFNQLQPIVDYCETVYGPSSAGSWLVFEGSAQACCQARERLLAWPGALGVLHRTSSRAGETRQLVLTRLSSDDLRDVLALVHEMADLGGTFTVIEPEQEAQS